MTELNKKYKVEHVAKWAGTIEDRKNIVNCMNHLRPELQEILDLELEAGNHVSQASRDWPDPESVFITLMHPFQKQYEVKDPVKYQEPNDPHYWKADYSCGRPVHVLAC